MSFIDAFDVENRIKTIVDIIVFVNAVFITVIGHNDYRSIVVGVG